MKLNIYVFNVSTFLNNTYCNYNTVLFFYTSGTFTAVLNNVHFVHNVYFKKNIYKISPNLLIFKKIIMSIS